MADEATPIGKVKAKRGAPPGVVRAQPVLSIRREAPPVATGGRGNRSQYDEALSTAKNDPGEWYVLIDSARTAGTGSDAMRRRGCEITTRRNEDGSWRIWFRWPANGDSA